MEFSMASPLSFQGSFPSAPQNCGLYLRLALNQLSGLDMAREIEGIQALASRKDKAILGLIVHELPDLAFRQPKEIQNVQQRG